VEVPGVCIDEHRISTRVACRHRADAAVEDSITSQVPFEYGRFGIEEDVDLLAIR
jgi:hypothetical protein